MRTMSLLLRLLSLLFRQPDAPTLVGKGAFSEERKRTVNGTVLRWTPGPDELRLPSCEDEPVSQNSSAETSQQDTLELLQTSVG